MPHGGAYAKQQSASWTPASLTGLVSWFDASDTATITSASSLVSQINDKFSTHHMTQGTGANKPLTATDTINGLNVLKFSTNSVGVSATVAINQPCTVWGIVKTTAISGRTDILVGSSGPGIYLTLSGSNWDQYAGSVADSGITPTTAAHLLIGFFNGASSHLQVDGTVGSTVDAGSNNISAIAWGGNIAANAFDVGEGGWCSGLIPAGDITSLRTYCQSKWATA